MTAKDLKNALLQEAVQGKLVPQIKSEGNARDLLEEIRKEKLSHGLDFANAKSGKRKSKKETALAGSNEPPARSARKLYESSLSRLANPCDIKEDEIPFEIPENWCWCKLGEIVNKLTDGSHNPPPAKTSGYPVISAMNIKNGKIILDNVNRYTDQQGFDKENPRTNITSGDIILGIIGGSIGNIAIYNLTEKVIAQRSIAIINTTVNNIYISLLLQSPYIQSQLQDSKGTAQGGVYLGSLKSLCIPLPPLAEQKRIVAAIEKFMPLIEEYGKRETELKAFNKQIGTLTKKAILQEAVQGKLVPQIASEGNAKDLLEEIRKERLSHGLDFANAKSGKRKSKKETALAGSNPCDISDDEIPFDIPENWCWCRLGEIVPFGQCSNAEPSEIEPDAWVLDLEDIEKDSGKILSYKTMKESDSKSTKHIFKKDYVLYSKLRPYLNKCVIATQDGYCTSEILPLNFGKYIYNKYAQLYLMSPFFVDYTNSLSFGVKMPRLGTEDGKKALFPLPPLSEQKRIVAAIEQLLPLCEKLGK